MKDTEERFLEYFGKSGMSMHDLAEALFPHDGPHSAEDVQDAQSRLGVELHTQGRWDDGPVWCRVDPVEPVDPWRRQWMRQHARRMLDSGGPWVVPAALVQQLRSEHHQNA